MAELFELSYVSKSVIDPAPEILVPEIEQILSIATVQNPDNDVTGALLYTGGYFCQVMEGDPEYLEQLFERIQCDKRHQDCKLLTFEPIEARRFGDWSMALVGIEPTPWPEIQGALTSLGAISTNTAGRKVIQDMLAKIEEQIRAAALVG